jgi:anaerobic ribonucleoside-triphosphate reductase activating protein
MFDADGTVWLAGIPSRGDLQRLKLLLESQGTYLVTTEARA